MDCSLQGQMFFGLGIGATLIGWMFLVGLRSPATRRRTAAIAAVMLGIAIAGCIMVRSFPYGVGTSDAHREMAAFLASIILLYLGAGFVVSPLFLIPLTREALAAHQANERAQDRPGG